ncbi:MAG: hypothetical protein WBG90_08730 [Saonia sp.]
METKKATFKERITDNVFYSTQFWIFFFLTIAMLIVGGIFYVPGIVDHPQFKERTDTVLIQELMNENFWLSFSYYTFFILDFFWAFLLLLLSWKYFKKKTDQGNKKSRQVLVLFTVLVSLAYLFDVSENLWYLFTISFSKVLVYGKMGFYGLAALVFILRFIQYAIKELYPIVKKFVRSSFYSLLILLVIGVLLPTAPQVNSIIVDLYLEWWNFAILLLLFAPVFAVVIAHYPTYFDIQEDHRKWYMAKLRVAFLGVVHFRYNKDYKDTRTGKTEGDVNLLFRILGICFYVALFYMVVYPSQINFNWLLQTSKLALALLLCGVFLQYYLKELKDDWYDNTYAYLYSHLPHFYDGDYSPKIQKRLTKVSVGEVIEQKTLVTEAVEESMKEQAISVINRPIRLYFAILVVTIVLHITFFALLLVCEACSYSSITVILSLLCIISQMVTFIYYRAFRSIFRFSFFNSGFTSITNSFIKVPDQTGNQSDEEYDRARKKTIEEQKEKVLDFFTDHDFTQNRWSFRLLSKLGFGALSNNIIFLQANAILGMINAVFFLILNLWSDLSIAINAVLIILSALFLYYGVFVVLTKNYIYYKHSQEKHAKQNSHKFVYFALGILTVMLVAYGFTRIFNNNLFTLEPVERELNNELSLEEYVEKLPKTRTRYYIGCYGGGMKSNAWTMTVLNELYKRDNGFFSKTVCLSGVSGGTMGLTNMSAIIQQNQSNTTWGELITTVSTENILSLDLTHALGRDLFNYMFVPGLFDFSLSGKDRSSKVMDRYAEITNNDLEIEQRTPYREYWRSLYDSKGSYPVLISNTTNVRGNQGMSVSVKVKDSMAMSLLYHGVDNILEILPDPRNAQEQKTLTFYDASSTSNRFPLISPAAKIETKGHYNDGGIYENSGLLSAYKLFRAVNYLERTTCLDDLQQRNVFVNIVNDKNQYIKYVLRKALCNPIAINYHTELASILSSVASTEMTPLFIKEELRKLSDEYGQVESKTIYLPHRFTVADVTALIGEKLVCMEGQESTDAFLYEFITKHNIEIEQLINRLCDYGEKAIVEPPMSRVMAEPAFDFMKSMLGHDITESAINEILKH